MTQKLNLSGLAPENVKLRLRQRVGGLDRPWTETLTVSPGTYSPPLPPNPAAEALAAHLAPMLPTALGGTGTSVPDLDAIGVRVSTAAGPAPLAVSFQLMSDDPNWHAFVKFGTAVWTFSQHAEENYPFRSPTDKLAGETAGTAVGPFVAHVYVKGPGRGVATPVAHQWSVTLHYPGLPSRTITWSDGAGDVRAGHQATLPRTENTQGTFWAVPSTPVPCNAILVHDPDVWFAGRTVWYSPAYATVDAFYDAMLALETASPGSSDIYGWSGRTAAEMKALMRAGSGPDALRNAIGPLSTASDVKEEDRIYRLPIGQGWRFLIQASTTYTGATATDDFGAFNVRVDRFGTGADPVIDFSGATVNFGQVVEIGTGTELMNLKLVGPYDAANPPWAGPKQMQFEAHGVKVGRPIYSDMTCWRLDISGFNQQIVASVPGRRWVIADCHIHNWYNYGMFPSAMSESGIVGCRLAQKPGAVTMPRWLKDGGGGNNNTCHEFSQAEERAKFNWSKQVLPLTPYVDSGGKPILRKGYSATGRPASIPPDYDPANWPGITGNWGTHPYDTANGGTAAWDWWMRNWHYYTGWAADNLQALLRSYLEHYRLAPIHGPLRIAYLPAGLAIHQCEMHSRNGWSEWDWSTALAHPVTGACDVVQIDPEAFYTQQCFRLVTDGAIPAGYTAASAGISIWRLSAVGQGLTTGVQTAASTKNVSDSSIPHGNIVMDGVIVDSDLATIRLGPSGTVLRNSLIVSRHDAPAKARSVGMVGRDPDFELSRLPQLERTIQRPCFVYNTTLVFAGNRPLAQSFGMCDGVTIPTEDGRRIVEWNNVRLVPGTAPALKAAIEAVTAATGLTGTTSTQGTEAFGYAPLAGSNLIAAAAVHPQPALDLEGRPRPAVAAAGAFEAS